MIAIYRTNEKRRFAALRAWVERIFGYALHAHPVTVAEIRRLVDSIRALDQERQEMLDRFAVDADETARSFESFAKQVREAAREVGAREE